MEQLIKQYPITNIKREFIDDWTNNRKYDIVFDYNNKTYVLEMDGGFHYKDNGLSGQTVEESQAIDIEKDLMAIGQGMEIIRIDCDYSDVCIRHEYIKNNIISSELSKIFDLSNINWKEIEEASVSSLQVRSWELKRDNPNLITINIGTMLNLSTTTVCRYLKNGDKLGMCKYNPKEERLRLVSSGTYFIEVNRVLYKKVLIAYLILKKNLFMNLVLHFIEQVSKKIKGIDYFQRSKPYKEKYVFIKTPYGTTFEQLQEQLNIQKSL